MIEQITLKNANISDKSLHLSVQKTYSHKQGNNHSLDRSEVTGSGKKLFKQKGTGNARQGSNKPPNFRGGAVSMGPQNRDHSFNLNKKEKKLALKSALSTKSPRVNDGKYVDISEIVRLDTSQTPSSNDMYCQFPMLGPTVVLM